NGKEKAAAFAESARVLRPGGRISLWEPINRFGSGERRDSRFVGYPADGLGETTAKLHALYDAIQPPDSDPMLDFDERDLLQLAEEAGFSPIRLTLDARIESVEPRNWDGFLDTAWNPNVPTLREAMEQALSCAEAAQGKLPGAVPCGAQTTRETALLAEHAASVGADAVAVIAPPYFALDEDELLAHFETAASACAPLPFYLYEFEARSG